MPNAFNGAGMPRAAWAAAFARGSADVSSKTNGAINGNGLIPQPHGGALKPGGTKGHRGGGGRPPSIIREKCRTAFWKQLKLLEQIAEGEALEIVKDATGRETEMRKSAPISERLKAVDLMAKYGLGTTVTETDTEGNDAPRSQVVVYIPDNGRAISR